jgi:hypothetical protein
MRRGRPNRPPERLLARHGPAAVQVEIQASKPGRVKARLERFLDLVRLGRVVREDVDDTEWSRLIDATPAQVRSLLQTEGYFARGPPGTHARPSARASPTWCA